MSDAMQLCATAPRPLPPATDLQAAVTAAFGAWLERAGSSLTIRSCAVERVHPGRDGDLVLEFSLRLASGETETARKLTIWGTMFRDPKDAERRQVELASALRHDHSARPDERLGAFVALVEELGLLLQSAALDQRLPGLALALDVDAITPIIQGFLDSTDEAAGTIRDCAVEFRHAGTPGKRCTLEYRLRIEGGGTDRLRLIAKVYESPRRYHRAVKILSKLADARFEDRPDRLRVPRLIGHDEARRLVFMEHVPHRPVSELLDSPALEGHLARAARALAKVHGLALSFDRVHRAADEMTLVRRSAARAARVYPDLAGRHDDKLAALEAWAALCPGGDSVVIHGSYNVEHVLLAQAEVALIDLDNVALGDPAKDLGGFLAHLTRSALRLSWPDETIARLGRSFLAAYDSGLAEDRPSTIEFYYRAQLMRLSYMALRRPKFHDLAARIMTQSQRPPLWRSTVRADYEAGAPAS